MGFAVSPFGVTPYGIGTFGSFGVVDARAASLNSVLVNFERQPKSFDPVAFDSVLRPGNWFLEVLSPPTAIVRFAQYVTVGVKSATVFFDGVLTYGALYRITVAASVVAVDDELIDPTRRTAEFTALGPAKVLSVAQEQSSFMDIANPYVPRYAAAKDRKLATFAATSSGTLELDRGVASLAKRCFRRVLTRRGSFVHMPTYGVDLPIKGLIRPNDLRKLQQDLLVQLRQEPQVVAASVSLRLDATSPGVVFCGIKVRSQTGVETSGTVPIDLSEL